MRFKAYLSIFAVVGLSAVGAFLVCGSGSCNAQSPSPLEASHAWSRATSSTASGVAYLTLTNHGDVDDVLTLATASVAK